MATRNKFKQILTGILTYLPLSSTFEKTSIEMENQFYLFLVCSSSTILEVTYESFMNKSHSIKNITHRSFHVGYT